HRSCRETIGKLEACGLFDCVPSMTAVSVENADFRFVRRSHNQVPVTVRGCRQYWPATRRPCEHSQRPISVQGQLSRRNPHNCITILLQPFRKSAVLAIWSGMQFVTAAWLSSVFSDAISLNLNCTF